jgi:parvulin-like peptidyl-prolyl isomerase
MQFRFWSENHQLEDLFFQLYAAGMDSSLVDVLGKQLIYLKSIQEYNIEPKRDPKDHEVLLFEFRKSVGLQDEVSLEKWLKSQNKTREALIRQLVFSNQFARLKKIVIPDQMVRDAYVNLKPGYDQLTFAILRLEEESLAQELYHRLVDDGQDFSELARQFSVGSEGLSGGLVGPLSYQKVIPSIRNRLLQLQPGELTLPFFEENHFLIAKLIRNQQSQLTPELVRKIREQLFEQWVNRQFALAQVALVPTSESQQKTSSKPFYKPEAILT